MASLSKREECVFCKRIFEGQYEQSLLHDIVTFVPLNPVVPGHRLFVPASHVDNATDGEAGGFYGGRALHAAGLWAARDMDDTGATGWNFITSAGRHATQTVFHLHLHLIPRRRRDGIALPWTGQHG